MPNGGLKWKRSSRCDSGSCVEVAPVDGGVLVRDSKDPAGPMLRFSSAAWTAFTVGLVAGDFGAQ